MLRWKCLKMYLFRTSCNEIFARVPLSQLMMEEKAWSKLHLSLRGPQPCEKNCFGMSQDIRIVCSFLFSPFFTQLMMEEKAWFEFTSHWEALNPVKRFQNPCDAASECQDISRYFAIFFPTSSSLLCEEGQSQLIPTDFIYTSPNLVKTDLRRCCWNLVPNLVT